VKRNKEREERERERREEREEEIRSKESILKLPVKQRHAASARRRRHQYVNSPRRCHLGPNKSPPPTTTTSLNYWQQRVVNSFRFSEEIFFVLPFLASKFSRLTEPLGCQLQQPISIFLSFSLSLSLFLFLSVFLSLSFSLSLPLSLFLSLSLMRKEERSRCNYNFKVHDKAKPFCIRSKSHSSYIL
jgi:hypothetical protein